LDPSLAQDKANATGFRPAVDAHFDKILFLNDIFFFFLTLLSFSSPQIVETTVQHVL
jgi:hypothetical protein